MRGGRAVHACRRMCDYLWAPSYVFNPYQTIQGKFLMKPMRPEILPPTKPLPRQRRRGGSVFLIVLGCVIGLVFAWLERDRLFNVGAPAGVQAKVYYLSPAGSDSNSGQSASVP